MKKIFLASILNYNNNLKVNAIEGCPRRRKKRDKNNQQKIKREKGCYLGHIMLMYLAYIY
jgi:hypothetical protein